MGDLFTRVSLDESDISINLSNHSFQFNQNEFYLDKLKSFLSELVDFEYTNVNIYYSIQIHFNNPVLHKNKYILWNEIDEDRLINLMEDIIEEIQTEGEIN